MSTKTRVEIKFELSCPAPLPAKDTILLGHGSGGKLSAELIRDLFLPAFQNPALARLDDQAIVNVNGQRLAMTTDSFVVKPLFFPGGDIGSLAVHGTVNDLAMGGATPLFLSAAFIIEEGFPMEDLRRVVQSVARGRSGRRRAGCHGRYQGRRKRQGRRAIHQHDGNRPGARGSRFVRRPCPSRAIRCCSAVRSAIMASRSWRSARAWNSRPKSKATAPPCIRWSLRCSTCLGHNFPNSLHARSYARRRLEHLERNRRTLQRWH